MPAAQHYNAGDPLSKYKRDFSKIPRPDYGVGEIAAMNKAAEDAKIDFLEAQLRVCLKQSYASGKKHVVTLALIAGDIVILDAIAKEGLIDQTDFVFLDTLHLFPETLAYLAELEGIYGFKTIIYYPDGYHPKSGKHDAWSSMDEGTETQLKFWKEKGDEFYLDTAYDGTCKVGLLKESFRDLQPEVWINGRRRDHGAERAMLPMYQAESKMLGICMGHQLNAVALWSLEDCWSYLRKHSLKYHPLHDIGYPSIGDSSSTNRVVDQATGKAVAFNYEKGVTSGWFAYDGERAGRFLGMTNADGSKKTECGIHSK